MLGLSSIICLGLEILRSGRILGLRLKIGILGTEILGVSGILGIEILGVFGLRLGVLSSKMI